MILVKFYLGWSSEYWSTTFIFKNSTEMYDNEAKILRYLQKVEWDAIASIDFSKRILLDENGRDMDVSIETEYPTTLEDLNKSD